MSTSLTDTPEWREFCRTADVSTDAFLDDPIVERTLGLSVAKSQVRYRQIAQEIRELFGSLAGMSVLEIGGGYGGQALALADDGNRPLLYGVVDLPEVVRLQRAYLWERADIPVYSPGIVSEPDLVISNYALSELTATQQRDYLRRLVTGAPRGYMRYNWINPASLSREELEPLLPEGAEWLPEVPLTHPLNQVLVWGHR